VFRYKASTLDPQAIGQALGVRAVLSGRLQMIGARVLTRVELLDTMDGTNIWGDQFQHASTDVLALEEKLVDAIAEQLRVRLTRDEHRRRRLGLVRRPRAHADDPTCAWLGGGLLRTRRGRAESLSRPLRAQSIEPRRRARAAA